MFNYRHNKDILETDAEAIINTVNCVGVMGKGLALKFKEKFPENYKIYKKYCEQKKLKTGNVLVTEFGGALSNDHKYLMNFPTKQHWRGKSKIEYIEQGLDDLILKIKKHNISSVAIPPLGCGNGGLNWDDVHDLVKKKLQPISDKTNIIIYAPPIKLRMTESRALLIKILHDFSPYFDYYVSHIIVQKIAYLLKSLGVDDYPEFKKNAYGPYSEGLENALKKMAERKFIKLSDDFDDNPDSKILVTAEAIESAHQFFETLNQKTQQKYYAIIDKLSKLIDRYESSFGLELLTTAHFLITSGNNKLSDAEEVVNGFEQWSDRKKNIFDKTLIENAYSRLVEDKIV
ncbi:MAG: macro domain-containing protein [Alphaproteobacteria bacterium]|nr:macro domain-containing protein [Alphaproteobacteria bacterium]